MSKRREQQEKRAAAYELALAQLNEQLRTQLVAERAKVQKLTDALAKLKSK
jgi:hypothetical protein